MAEQSAGGPVGAIEVQDAGIRFRRNRRSRRNLKDLFAGRKRRARANEFWALRNVTFSVRPGEAIGVVGRNGRASRRCSSSWPRSSCPTRER